MTHPTIKQLAEAIIASENTKYPMLDFRAEGYAIAALRSALSEGPVRDMIDALKIADTHTKELRNAWERGAINECDGLGRTRLNRNVDVDVSVRKALAAIAELDRALK